jgi:hypothetical protein
MAEQYGFVTEPAVVMEMTTDGTGTIDVPVEEGLIASLSDGDKNPMFVTIEVINEGVSRNGRAYDKDTINSLAEQINSKKPDGYYGHLTDEERKTKFPEPQTIWIGAKVTEVGGKTRLFAKGYVLPEAKGLRSYLKKAKAAGKNIAVSVYGLAQVVSDKVNNISIVKSMSLESIDWARPGSEGVLNMGLFSVTSEMATSNIIEQGVTMDKVEVLKSATVDELKENNPELVSEMIVEAVASKDSELAEAQTIISEMTEKLTAFELDSQLQDKVESATARKVVKQLVISEMSSGTPVSEAVDKVLGSETGQALIKEMLEVAPMVAPKTEQPSALARKFTKKG